MNLAVRLPQCVPFVLAILLGNSAQADLYTGGVLSLPWLVDSSDEIFHVRTVAVEKSPERLTVVPQAALKSRLKLDLLKWMPMADKDGRPLVAYSSDMKTTRFLRDANGHWVPPQDAKDGDEWLLFVRISKEETLRIVQAVNLTRPLEHSWTAAITAQGEPLADKASILKAADQRIRLKRTLPAECNRALIDGWKDDRSAILRWTGSGRRPKPSRVRGILGGFAVPILCDYFDHPGDEDLSIVSAVVPADPEFLPMLLEQIRPERRWRVMDGLTAFALLNYPGKEVDEALQKLVSETGSYQAGECLWHRQYYRLMTSSEHKPLVGDWVMLGRIETIELTLREDRTCTILCTNHHEAKTVYGKGRWGVADGRFWFERTEAVKRGRWAIARRHFFHPKRLEKLTENECVLEDGPPMKRR